MSNASTNHWVAASGCRLLVYHFCRTTSVSAMSCRAPAAHDRALLGTGALSSWNRVARASGQIQAYPPSGIPGGVYMYYYRTVPSCRVLPA